MFKKIKRQKLWKQREQVEQELDWLYAQRRHLVDLLKIHKGPELVEETIKAIEVMDATIAKRHEDERVILDEWYRLY